MDKETRKKHYSVWTDMKQRCKNPNHKAYPNYGGRGITVCAEWDASFDQFMLDMGERPTDDHQIDRTDNNGGYEPGNCEWRTRTEQQLNREVSKNGGIHKNTTHGYWEAHIQFLYQKVHLGCFQTEEEARIARKAARRVVDALKDRGVFGLNLKELLCKS